MEIARAIELPETTKQAFILQRQLSHELCIQPLPSPIERIASCDVAYHLDTDVAYAGIVVLSRQLEILERVAWVGPAPSDYESGLFGMREAEVLYNVFHKLETRPDVIFVDGHGLAHPRGFGLACQMGLSLGIPTIGVAKRPLFGDIEAPALERGSRGLIRDGEDVLGCALRTQTGVKPIYVSPGHLADVQSSADLTLELTPHYRQPEPIREAHRLSIELRAGRVTPDSL